MRKWLLPIALASLGLIVEGVERPGDDKFGLIEGGETLFGYGYGLTEIAAGGASNVQFTVDATDPSPSNLSTSITLNGTTVAAKCVYDASNLVGAGSSWPAVIGPTLTATGSGGSVAEAHLFGASDNVALPQATRYWMTSDTTCDLGGDDFVVEAVIRAANASGYYVSNFDPGASIPGNALYRGATNSTRFFMRNATPTTLALTPGISGTEDLMYQHILIIADRSGSVRMYVNGRSAVTGTPPTGALSDGTGLSIGADTGGTNPSPGGIVRYAVWEQSAWLDTHAQDTFAAERFAQLMDLNDQTNAAAMTYTNTGPICASFSSSTLDCVSDDMPLVGSEIPVGMTGAGGGSGFQNVNTYTNSILYSRDFSNAAWTDTGTTETCAQTDTPFNDGRTTCLLQDDDAGASESSSQLVTHGLSNGQVVTVQYWAKGASQTLYVELSERTGGSCSNPAAATATESTTGSWTQYSISYTLSAAVNCTQAKIEFFPAGDATASSTGGPIYVTAVQMLLNQPYEIPVYAETTSSAVTYGDTDLSYSGPDNTTAGTYTYTTTYTPTYADFLGSRYLLNWDSDQDWRMLYTVSEAEILQNPNNSVVGVTGAPAAGTDEIWIGSWNSDGDVYNLSVRGNAGAEDTGAETAPTTFVNIEFGNLIGASQADGWFKDTVITYDAP